jgi:hypothetical protein
MVFLVPKMAFLKRLLGALNKVFIAPFIRSLFITLRNNRARLSPSLVHVIPILATSSEENLYIADMEIIQITKI